MKVAAAVNANRKLGRPLSFNRRVALQQAMLAFWRHGYETTSIVDLTKAMGITAPSLYAAFGDKKQLFLEALHFYGGDADATRRRINAAPTAQDAARDLLATAAETFTGKTTPKGCLLASATASGSSSSVDVQRAVAKIRHTNEMQLRTRIERDVAAGMLPMDTDAAALSGLVIAVIQGMSVLARDGAKRSTLQAIGNAAIGAWQQPIQ